MKIVMEPGKTGNVIATNAIGGTYYESWLRWSYPAWKRYCERHALGLIVFDKNIIDSPPKKPYWQKLLIGDALKRSLPDVRNACFLDTDILINYTAPNIFDAYDPDTIGFVSQKNNLPYPYEGVRRRIAFLRHTFLDKNYPLDSWLFASPEQIFESHNLPCQKDFGCTGLFIFNIGKHADILRSWYKKYGEDVKTMDGGTEQVHLNYEIQDWGKVTWLDYRYQALWMYEMAWKYPFLYDCGRNDHRLIKECIEASLSTNYFLHFAGAWEGEMWKTDGILGSERSRNYLEEFSQYEKMPLTGNPKGIIKPKKAGNQVQA